jgi:hypothetical protein
LLSDRIKAETLYGPDDEGPPDEPANEAPAPVAETPKTATPTLDRMKAMREARAAKQAAKKAALQPA